MGFQIFLWKFHKNSLSERLLEGKAVILRWINRTQNSFSESFFSVFILLYFLFHHSPLWASKYLFANSTTTVLEKASWGEYCNSVRWINRTQNSFSESFFAVFNWRYFLFHHTLYGLTNITFQIPQDSLIEWLLEGKAVIPWDELREHKAVSQTASFQFLTEDISFFTIALYGLPNITLQISQEQP